ncbi:MAG: hypothetical protein K9N35_01080 [Candidatus Marinimicrobia bacterium]|nr:hypothetical protein [Candidatus Neomarinimicrobiota bacterium]
MLKHPTPISDDKQNPARYPTLEFHLRRALSEAHDLHLPIFSLENGKFNIAYRELQELVQDLNESDASLNLSVSELHGMGLLSLIYHKVIRLYRNQIDPEYIAVLKDSLIENLGQQEYEELLEGFLTALPSQSVQSTSLVIRDYLKHQSGNISNENIVVEELLIHLLALQNPAFESQNVVFKEDFHKEIKNPGKLLAIIKKRSNDLHGFGKENQNLIDLLMEPMRSAPSSIRDQLIWIKSNWANFMGSHLFELLKGLDLFEEEYRFRGPGPGETKAPSYSGDLLDGEFYSEDSAWMPSVVMIARNSLVWLDQLSKKYKYDIRTLDAIPDRELDLLAAQGFTVLWLIGLWNRSDISKKIKHWCGNPDAESSAYSLKEYKIDPSIGGAEALENLKRRAWKRGIRLASDMVPNHTGLDSNWLKYHSDWYVTSDYAPFPAYTFNGGDLSEDPDVSIHLEDHYYVRSDAAVVFKYEDHRSGQTHYVYHGNDGTSMPWNDTAQLNYLNPELREHVIQTILDVARQFKVIRFDAAMTLAKRHIQRLWYPEPGSGGDIPSRSAFNMDGASFNAAMPAEFWREVVDRVAKEVPDTLLLAEAFWMMEGYFVRTLGMHRVYNSAFMNMLKMEENKKFFDMIASTLEFDPRILQRFVNFLSNPDEDTAIAQFGKGDKYFGATILMVTLPGLPMFAHAQIEGFEEKYGMEYRRAYWDESPDHQLVKRHEDQIFPLMKKRYLFAGAGNFRLFPMYDSGGNRVDSVLAYTNRFESERSFVVVNNSYSSHAGWINNAVPFNSNPTADQAELLNDNLISALAFEDGNMEYIIFQEQISRLWFIRRLDDIRDHGLFLELSGYASQIYLNFQVVNDNDSIPWSRVLERLNGEGVIDFAIVHRTLELEPIHKLFKAVLKKLVPFNEPIHIARFGPLFEAMLDYYNLSLEVEEIENFTSAFDETSKNMKEIFSSSGNAIDIKESIIFAVLALSNQVNIAIDPSKISIVNAFELHQSIIELAAPLFDEELPTLISALEMVYLSKADPCGDLKGYFTQLFSIDEVNTYLLINEADGVVWFNKERMEAFLKYFMILNSGQLSREDARQLHLALDDSNYQIHKFLKALN